MHLKFHIEQFLISKITKKNLVNIKKREQLIQGFCRKYVVLRLHFLPPLLNFFFVVLKQDLEQSAYLHKLMVHESIEILFFLNQLLKLNHSSKAFTINSEMRCFQSSWAPDGPWISCLQFYTSWLLTVVIPALHAALVMLCTCQVGESRQAIHFLSVTSLS